MRRASSGATPPDGEVLDLPVVVVAAGDRLLEDRGVRRHAHDVVVPHQTGEAAGGQPGALRSSSQIATPAAVSSLS
jgi:hypothetical protein